MTELVPMQGGENPEIAWTMLKATLRHAFFIALTFIMHNRIHKGEPDLLSDRQRFQDLYRMQ